MKTQNTLITGAQLTLEFAIDDLVQSISLMRAVHKHQSSATSSLDAFAALQLLGDSESQFLSTIRSLLKTYSMNEILASTSFDPVREWVRKEASANEIMAMLQHHIDPVCFGIEIAEYATITNRLEPESTLIGSTAILIEVAYHIQTATLSAA